MLETWTIYSAEIDNKFYIGITSKEPHYNVKYIFRIKDAALYL